MIPRIQLQNPQSLWGAMIVLVIAVVLVFWLYRGHAHSSRSGIGWLLPVLRGVALGALVLSLFRPEILSPVQDDGRGAVVVIVDQSRSMSAVDSGRSEAELVQLAAALGELPAGVRSPELSDLRGAIRDLTPLVEQVERSRSEQRYAQLAGRGIEAAETHLRDAQGALRNRVVDLAATAPAGLAGMVSQIDGADATEGIAQAIARIDQIQQEADTALYRANPQVQQIGSALAAQSRISLVGRALEGDGGLIEQITERPVRVLGLSQTLSPLAPPFDQLEAQGTHGDFPAALRALHARMADEHIGAIVLFSDGHRIAGFSPAPVFGPEVPVFAVSAAARTHRDLSIERIWLPETVFVGEPMQVAVSLRAAGYDSPEVQVTIESAGQRHSARVIVQPAGGIARLPFRIEKAGPQVLSVEVTGLPGEATVENNRVERIVRVIAEQTRVALLGGARTADFEYFRAALKRDPSVQVTDHLIVGEAQAISPEQILEQDVVVLVDMPSEALDSVQWDAVNRLVNQKGGSVIIATTDSAITGGYAANPMAAGLLPWRRDVTPTVRAWPGAEAVFRIAPASDGATDAFLWDDSDPTAPRWNELPPVFRFLGIPSLRAAARPLLVERDSNPPLPVAVEHSLGAGRVLFLGLDELWRWRDSMVDGDSDRLWLRLVHQIARPPFAATGGGLGLDVASFTIAPGQPARVRLRAPGGAVLEVRRGDAVVTSRTITPAVEQEIALSELPAGEYQLRLIASDRGAEVSLPLVVRDQTEAEMRDVSGDPEQLQSLAGLRGEVLELSEVHTLPQRLGRLKESDPVFVETRLWDSPYLFAFVLACLGVEWALRKRVGLV